MTGAALQLLQLTDLHLFASPQLDWKGFNTYSSFQAVVAQVATLVPPPDALLLTGDLSQDDSPESYHHIRTLLAPLGIPTYWVPGNHDQTGLAAEILSTAPFCCDRKLEEKGWRVLLLNSMAEGRVYGILSEAEIDWLTTQLAQAPEQPTLIVLHHPPVVIESAWMDAIGLQDSQHFLQVVDAHPQVKGVLFGHIHQAFQQNRNGVQFLGCPSTCIQFVPNQPEMLLDSEAPGFRQLFCYPDGTWQTQVMRVPLPAVI